MFLNFILLALSFNVVGALHLNLYPRADNAAQVQRSLTQLGSDLKALNTTLNMYPTQGPITSSQMISIVQEQRNIDSDFKSANSSAASSSPFTAPESKAIATQWQGLQTPILQAMNNVVRHKTAFKANGWYALEEDVLQSFLADLKSLCTTLRYNCTPTETILQSYINSFST